MKQTLNSKSSSPIVVAIDVSLELGSYTTTMKFKSLHVTCCHQVQPHLTLLSLLLQTNPREGRLDHL